MKIDQLPYGTRFQYQGRTYTKTGPMIGTGEAGGTQFIPKYAVLQPVPGEALPPPPPEAAASPLEVAKVIAAFEAYHRTAMAFVDEAAKAQLESARVRFLAALR